MATLHFLNVLEGDCSVIEHASDRVTVIDVNNAEKPKPASLLSLAHRRLIDEQVTKAERGGNFQQKRNPVNPIEYLQDRGITNIFRFFLTHPDMDHMGGIKDFFEVFSPPNFWDTENKKEMESFEGSPYNEDDWNFYKKIKLSQQNPKRLVGYSGDTRKYLNQNEDDTIGGDYLHILAPTSELVKEANEEDDYHKASYVLLYNAHGGKIIFGGDSHDESWAHIIQEHRAFVSDISLLIAPHHGRSSSRSYEFLDVLKPKLTFFGNANSQHLAYSAWKYRDLPYITNNQANCMIVDTGTKPMELYVTNETFARSRNSYTFFSATKKAWYLGQI